MAVRYTVYCKKPAASVTPGQLLAVLQQADLVMMAENDGVSEELAELAEQHLAVADMAPDKPFTFYRLAYRPGDVRQIDIERWASTDEVRGELAELVEDLEAEHNAVLPKIRSHLDSGFTSVSFQVVPGLCEPVAGPR